MGEFAFPQYTECPAAFHSVDELLGFSRVSWSIIGEDRTFDIIQGWKKKKIMTMGEYFGLELLTSIEGTRNVVGEGLPLNPSLRPALASLEI